MPEIVYSTILTPLSYELPKIKWSRFIGDVFHVENKDDVERSLQIVKEKYPDASHHCYACAYEVQRNLDIFGNVVFSAKYNKAFDDGEPASTAGKPLMNLLEKRWLLNVLLVVTRYFGGTKLGVGGLIQAYGDCGRQTLEHAEICETPVLTSIQFSYPFELTQTVRNIAQKYHAQVIEEKYDEEAWIHLTINAWMMDDFTRELKDESKGAIVI